MRVFITSTTVILLLLAPALGAEAPVEIPRPDLSTFEKNLRTRFEARHAMVDSLARAGEDKRHELAEAYGALGQLYLVYELHEAAGACFHNAGALDPTARPWAYYRARALEKSGRHEAALAQYARAYTLDPEDPAALIRPARLHLAMNRPAAAAELFRRALELDSGRAAAQLGLAKVALGRDDARGAIEQLKRVLELQPAASSVHYHLAQAYRKTGDRDRAREHLARRGPAEVEFADPLDERLRTLSTISDFELVLALAAEPEGFSPPRLLTYTLTLLAQVEGTAEEIEETLRRSGESNPGYRARLHYLAGGLLAYRGEGERAIHHFRFALELLPDLEDARVKLANAEARRGRYDEALPLLSAVLEKSPELHAARLKRAAALMALGRYSEAVLDLRRLRRVEPPIPEAALRLAAALEAIGQADEAVTTYRAVAEILVTHEEQAQALHQAVLLLLRQGRFELARELCMEALRHSPGFTAARLTLAGLLGHLGQLEEAAGQYREALKHEPASEEAHLGEAAVLLVLERWEEARNRLEGAVKTLPESASLAHLLARLLAAAPVASVRDGERALALATALPLPADLSAKIQHADTLAMAYAESGRFDDAVRTLAEPMAAARRNGAAQVAEYLLAKTRRYESGQPWRAAAAGEIIGGLGPAAAR